MTIQNLKLFKNQMAASDATTKILIFDFYFFIY